MKRHSLLRPFLLHLKRPRSCWIYLNCILQLISFSLFIHLTPHPFAHPSISPFTHLSTTPPPLPLPVSHWPCHCWWSVLGVFLLTPGSGQTGRSLLAPLWEKINISWAVYHPDVLSGKLTVAVSYLCWCCTWRAPWAGQSPPAERHRLFQQGGSWELSGGRCLF